MTSETTTATIGTAAELTPADILAEIPWELSAIGGLLPILTPKQQQTMRRRWQVWQLRQTGMSYPQIGRAVGTSHVQAFRDIRRIEQALAANCGKD